MQRMAVNTVVSETKCCLAVILGSRVFSLIRKEESSIQTFSHLRTEYHIKVPSALISLPLPACSVINIASTTREVCVSVCV